MPLLDDKTQARLADELVKRAARNETGWQPAGPTSEGVSEVVAFAEAARKVGYADPSDVDDYLQRGRNAFLARDYRAAIQIFRALLIPITECDIDLGQHEFVDEVLGVAVEDCAAQYVVAAYMTSTPSLRAEAVRAAIDEMSEPGHFWEPLGEMERVAVEPLPNIDDFLPRWRALVEKSAGGKRRGGWGAADDLWLREVVQRLEGTDGLAAFARLTRRSDDLRAWCRALADAGDWQAALAAYQEAAEIVTDRTYTLGGFLDGAALAAQELGRRDLPQRLEQAWRQAPSLLRLRRWLGSSGSRAILKKRTVAALEACPRKVKRQRALLHVLLGDLESAAKLLAAAPGLGWSDDEHPGHLLIPLFCRLLGDGTSQFEYGNRPPGVRDADIEELESLYADDDVPRLANPLVDDLIDVAGIRSTASASARTVVIKAMRKAAAKRIAGVVENKRRRHYGHAASLAAACFVVDPGPGTDEWLASIRFEYSRYSALQRELDGHVG